jgi:hypothetical protein
MKIPHFSETLGKLTEKEKFDLQLASRIQKVLVFRNFDLARLKRSFLARL